jgi:fibronectin type 3 domain-containing protein
MPFGGQMNKVREAAEFHPSISFTWHLCLAASSRAGLFLAGIGFAAAAVSSEGQYFSASPLLPQQQTHASDSTAPGPQTVQAVPQLQSALKAATGAQTIAADQTPKGIAPEAWSRIMADVQAKTYAVQSSQTGTLVADNPAQHLGALFTPRGVALTPVQHTRLNPHAPHRLLAKMPGAPFELRTQSVDGARNAPVSPVASANRVEYQHPGYVEWYVNDAKGLEQGWTLNAAALDGKSPSIRIAVGGARTVAEGADAIRIEDHQGKLRYRYAGLKVADATQRVLPAHLRLVRPGIIEIAVDDQGAQYPVTIDPALTVTETVALSDPAPNPPYSDNYGYSTAVNGDTVVIGASGTNSCEGTAYIYSRNQGGSGAWGLADTLIDPGATECDYFAGSVAVYGDTVIIGAFGNANQGKAYIYSRSPSGTGSGSGIWGLAATVSDPGATSGDEFAGSVAVNGDTAVIGASGTASQQGRAYVFSRNQGGAGAWGLAATLNDPAATSKDFFGSSVAVYGDTAVASASGIAYIFSRNQGGTGIWGLAASLNKPGAVGDDSFGGPVAVHGDTVLVGASSSGLNGKVCIFGRNQGGAGQWGIETILNDPAEASNENLNDSYNDSFGGSLAVYGDTVVVGARTGSGASQGMVYVFNRNQGGAGLWGLVSALSDPAQYGEFFGVAVALDGDTVVAGGYYASSNEGAAYIFDITGGTFTQAAGINDPGATNNDAFGISVAVNGDTMVVGAYGANSGNGTVYIYSRNQGGAGIWGLSATLMNPTQNKNFGNFGISVGVNGDTVVVGASADNDRQGAAFIYSRNQGGAGKWGLVATLSDPGATAMDNFGISIAVDGDTAAIGEWAINNNRIGNVYVYGRNQGGADAWGLAATLTDPEAQINSCFGSTVGVSGDTLVAGSACSTTSNNSNTGAAYVFSRNQGGLGEWGLSIRLSNPVGSDGFGNSIAVNGDTLVVGTMAYNVDQGIAYIFARNQGGAGQWGQVATLNNPTPASYTYFGFKVALDGDTVVVAADGANGDQGAAYVYSRNQGGAGSWGMTASLVDPAGTSNDYFGQNVAVNGETLAVGATGSGGTYEGNAYVYSLVTDLPAISVAPNTLSFAPQSTNSTSPPQAVTISNTGSATLTVSSLGFNGMSGESNGFSVSNNGCGSAVPPGGQCTVQVVFQTSGTGEGGDTESATLDIVSNAPTSPNTVSLSGSYTPPPPAPTNLTATTGSSGQVILNWAASPGATTYNVYQGTSPTQEATAPVQTGITATSATISGLTNGTQYFFEVKAVNAEGISAPSNEANATPTLAPPAPTNLTATAENGGAGLSWTASSGASDYYVFYGTTSGGETTKSAAVAGTSTTIAGLSNGTTYYFIVKAYSHSTGLTSAASNEVSAMPEPVPAPTNLAAALGNAQVSLGWTASYGASDYYVFYGTTSGGETTKSAAVTGTSTTIAGLNNGTTYYFVVKAYNHSSGITSAASNEVSAVPLLTTPAAPTNFKAVAGSGQVALSWTASAGNEASSYSLYEGTTSGGESGTPVQTGITGTSQTVGGLSAGGAYYFKVAGVNSSGTGALSAEVSVTLPPTTPTNLAATAGKAEVMLTWTASSGASDYYVYYGTSSGNATTKSAAVTGTSTAITGLSSGTTYYFVVKAYSHNTGLTSAASNQASATPN